MIYRPQRSYGKVMFSQASVILFTGEGVYIPACIGADTPLDKHPPTATAADLPSAAVAIGGGVSVFFLGGGVCILLECIHVLSIQMVH